MNNNGNILSKVGQNYYVKDCPFLVPQENIPFFSQMQRASSDNMVSAYQGDYSKSALFAKPGKVDFC